MCGIAIAPQLFTAMSKLSPAEQSQVTSFVVLFLGNSAHPSLQLHPLHKAKSPGIWSGKASRGLRVILHKGDRTWTLLHADQHDAAYDWALRRIVTQDEEGIEVAEVVETVREVGRVMVTHKVEALFQPHSDDYLLSLGVPEEWLPAVREVRTAEHLFGICEKLPPQTGDWLLALATGGNCHSGSDFQLWAEKN